MLCEKCKKNEATFYYHENVNGKKKSYNLCSECAAEMEKNGEINTVGPEKYLDSFESFFEDFGNPFKSMDKLLAGFFGTSPALSGRVSGEEKKCPTCGMTLKEFAESGTAGCPDCYEAFSKELEPTITRVQGKSRHSGRAPLRLRETLESKKKIEELEKEQKQAIMDENYERAAEIRDELKKLRGNDCA